MTRKIVVTPTKKMPQQAVEQTVIEPKRQSFIGKMMRVIANDIRCVLSGTDMITSDPPAGWEDYRRFCEMARGKK